MTCLEAQSKIIAYIEFELEKDQKTEFLKHIQCCENCKEELNIYYTMIEGMRQLDSNMPLSKDFSRELEQRIDSELRRSRNKKTFFQSSVAVVFLGVISCLVFAYMNFLSLVHEEEQKQLKEAQGEYYYMETFADVLFEPEEQEYILNVENEEPKMSFYEKIRAYHVMNP